MGGFPPMGIILGLDGILSGTPTGTTSTFKVCAVDTAGNSSCKPTSITVRSDCNPALTGTWVGTYSLDFNTILCDGGLGWIRRWSATVYLQQIGTTVMMQSQLISPTIIASLTQQTERVISVTLWAVTVSISKKLRYQVCFPSYFIYTNDFDIYDRMAR
jgi:hypothetical protein